MKYVGQTIDQFRSRWSNYKDDLRKHGQKAASVQQHLFKHFCTSGYCGFLEDASLTFIDKTDPSDSLKREDYCRSTLVVESKERPFHQFTSSFPNRNSF